MSPIVEMVKRLPTSAPYFSPNLMTQGEKGVGDQDQDLFCGFMRNKFKQIWQESVV